MALHNQIDYFWRTIPSKETRYQRDLHTIALWGEDDELHFENNTTITRDLYYSEQDGPYRILFRQLKLSLSVGFSQGGPNYSALPYWGYYRFSINKAGKGAGRSSITTIWTYSSAAGTGVDQPELDLPWIEVGADEYLMFEISFYRAPIIVPTDWHSKWLAAAWMDTYTQY